MIIQIAFVLSMGYKVKKKKQFFTLETYTLKNWSLQMILRKKKKQISTSKQKSYDFYEAYNPFKISKQQSQPQATTIMTNIL